ncbi:hypothetical protein Agub_g7429, partial [Astrephomene gubernaculifera]
QEQSAQLDPSLAPPQPPPQQPRRGPEGGSSGSAGPQGPGAAAAEGGGGAVAAGDGAVGPRLHGAAAVAEGQQGGDGGDVGPRVAADAAMMGAHAVAYIHCPANAAAVQGRTGAVTVVCGQGSGGVHPVGHASGSRDAAGTTPVRPTKQQRLGASPPGHRPVGGGATAAVTGDHVGGQAAAADGQPLEQRGTPPRGPGGAGNSGMYDRQQPGAQQQGGMQGRQQHPQWAQQQQQGWQGQQGLQQQHQQQQGMPPQQWAQQQPQPPAQQHHWTGEQARMQQPYGGVSEHPLGQAQAPEPRRQHWADPSAVAPGEPSGDAASGATKRPGPAIGEHGEHAGHDAKRARVEPDGQVALPGHAQQQQQQQQCNPPQAQGHPGHEPPRSNHHQQYDPQPHQQEHLQHSAHHPPRNHMQQAAHPQGQLRQQGSAPGFQPPVHQQQPYAAQGSSGPMLLPHQGQQPGPQQQQQQQQWPQQQQQGGQQQPPLQPQHPQVQSWPSGPPQPPPHQQYPQPQPHLQAHQQPQGPQVDGRVAGAGMSPPRYHAQGGYHAAPHQRHPHAAPAALNPGPSHNGWPPPNQQQSRPMSPLVHRQPPHAASHAGARPMGHQEGGPYADWRPPPSSNAHAPQQPYQQPQQQRQEPQPPLASWGAASGPGRPGQAPSTAPLLPLPGATAVDEQQLPLLRSPGFTLLKTAAEVAAACEQLKRAGLWGFMLDFADAALTPVSVNPGLQLPGVPQVALGRGLQLNSIGLPLHFDMEAEAAAVADATGGEASGTTGCNTSSSSGRLEGIALCAFDGCALYVPLMATTE